MDSEFEVLIERLAYGGAGVGRLDGRTVFIPFTAPGDRVRAVAREVQPRWIRAEKLQLLEAGPARREPKCRHFEACGGCHFQHIDAATQAEAKVGFVREALRRIAKIEDLGPIPLHTGAEYGYRLRARFEVAATEDGPALAFRAGSSHDLVPLTECPILVPELAAQLRPLATTAVVGTSLEVIQPDSGPPLVDAQARAEDDAAPIRRRATSGISATGRITVQGITYRVKARNFFQAHRGLLELLQERVLPAEGGNLAFDLFAGVGFFSIPLAARFTQVIAVESDREALAMATATAATQSTSAPNTRAESVLTFLKGRPPRPDFALMDPPRDGAKDEAPLLAALRPPRIHYLSCDPNTLARDLRVFMDAGYRIDSVEAFDLFPQTFHVETLIRLSLP